MNDLNRPWSSDLLTRERSARINYGYGIGLGVIEYVHNELIRAARNNIEVRRWTRQSGLNSSEAQMNWWKEKYTKDQSMQMFSIYGGGEEFADKFSGVCGLTSISAIHRSAEFSIYIVPDQQKLGYGAAALKTLIRHGFEDLNLHCIWGESFSGNNAMRMFEKVGFKKDGIRRQCYYKEGKYVDAHIFTLLRSEWNP